MPHNDVSQLWLPLRHLQPLQSLLKQYVPTLKFGPMAAVSRARRMRAVILIWCCAILPTCNSFRHFASPDGSYLYVISKGQWPKVMLTHRARALSF